MNEPQPMLVPIENAQMPSGEKPNRSLLFVFSFNFFPEFVL